LTDELLDARGGQRVAERGYADAAAGNLFNDFDRWEDQVLWPSIRKVFGDNDAHAEEPSGLDVEVTASVRTSSLHQDVREAIVTDTRALTAESEPPKKHIMIKLPTNMTYRAGDYLAILPLNQPPIIRRVLQRFELPWDAKIIIKPGQNTILPVGEPLSVFGLLGGYVELSQPATLKVGLFRPTTA
jgi:cytochrome P450/NADPH-cytochrome P450 reductase